MNTSIEIQTKQLGADTETVRTETVESFSTTFRNVGLVAGGIVAVILALWRSLVAQRQAETTLHQVQIADRGSRLTLRSFLNERYEQGSSKLESDVLSVRLDGINALERLAREYPSEYHVQVVKRLCLFVCIVDNAHRTRIEVRVAMEAIGSRSEEDINLEKNESYELSLLAADLQGLRLAHLNLSGANLDGANLSDAILDYTNLSSASLLRANLRGAGFSDANLSGTQFSIGAGWGAAEGLIQFQLDVANAYKDNPPYLNGVLDDETSEKLNPPTREPGWLENIMSQVEAHRQSQAKDG